MRNFSSRLVAVPNVICAFAIVVASFVYVTVANPPSALASSQLQWTTVAPMPTARGGLGATVANSGKIYAIGGQGSNGSANPYTYIANEEYDPARNIWATRASMPTPRLNLGVVTGSDGKIYAIGGDGGTGPLGTNEQYDPTTDTWSNKAGMPTTRSGLEVVATDNGKLYAFGGQDRTSNSTAVEEYDIASDTWTTKTNSPMTTGFDIGGIFISNGKIYITGNQFSAILQVYDIATDSWSSTSNAPSMRGYTGFTLGPDGNIYVIGGVELKGNDASVANTVERYNPTSNSWSTSTTMASRRYALATVTDNNGNIFALGGFDSFQGTAISTVERATIPPSVGAITVTTSPTQVNSAIGASASFTDFDVFSNHTATWDWGDGNTTSGTVSESNGSGSVSGSHIYTQTGVYTVTLTVTNNHGASGTGQYQYVAVYNPTGGFLTGSGKYNSLAGWDTQNPSAAGEVKFGVSAQYLTGSNVPTGQAKVNFKVGNLDFQATSFQWLVVSGAKATLQGTGTINGSGVYTFLLSGIDGAQTGGASLIRVKITDALNSVVYDTQPGAPDTADPTTPLTQGSIKVH